MSKKKKSKAKAPPAARYYNQDQKNAVKALVRFFLSYEKDHDLDCISRETLQLAVNAYSELADAAATPGCTILYKAGDLEWRSDQ